MGTALRCNIGSGTSSRSRPQNLQLPPFCLTGYIVLTWGCSPSGGNSSAVQDRTCSKFRPQLWPLLLSGPTGRVTWGDPGCGGDNFAVQGELRNVREIQRTGLAFAAILADGLVVTWGNPGYGGDSSAVRHELLKVQRVHGTNGAFAAILADGSVVTWGYPDCGGESSAVKDQLLNVLALEATSGAFAAVLADRSLITWGASTHGGDSSKVRISSGTCSEFRQHIVHLLRPWLTDQS